MMETQAKSQPTVQELLQAIKKGQEQTQQIADTLSRSVQTRWDVFKRAVPWIAVAVVEISLFVSESPLWRNNFSQSLINAEAALLTGIGSDAIYSKELLVGDKVAGYTVTSDFGPRTAPLKPDGSRGSTDHKGVDLDTPVGVPLYMIGIGEGQVTCHSDPGGYGKYVKVQPYGLQYTFLLAHLQKCREGTYEAGKSLGFQMGYSEPIARTGATGEVFPHLHLEMHYEGIPVPPTHGYVDWFLQGRPPSTGIPSTNPKVAKVRDAIIGQESGGDSKAINNNGGAGSSRAAGLGQVMPENIPVWTREALGRSLTYQEFLNDADAQIKTIDFKLNQYWEQAEKVTRNEEEIVRRVASQWYSGQPQLWRNTRPQTYGGRSYPSIAQYTRSVYRRYRRR